MITDQAAGGNLKLHFHPSVAGVGDIAHLRFAFGELVHDRTAVLLRAVDIQIFYRFGFSAMLIGLENRTGTPDTEFKSFAPHLLNDDGQLEFATSFYAECVIGILLNPDRDVSQAFFLQSLPNFRRGDLRAILTG